MNGDSPADRRLTATPRPASQLLPGDGGWTADNALMAELTQLNAQVSKYVLQYLDADAGRAEPISVEDERSLAERLAMLAMAVQHRATRRAALGETPWTIEDAVSQPMALEPGRKPMDNGP